MSLTTKKKDKKRTGKNGSAYPRIFGMFEPDLPSDGIFSRADFPNVEDFERKREEDGTFIIDLVPECRVFIYGIEVTHDVLNLTINYKISGASECSISMANPRGKYEISRQDLMKNWREDKDILTTYGYDWLKRLDPLNFDPIKMGARGLLGDDVVNQGKEIWAGTKQAFFEEKSLPNSIQIRNATRMIFETKFYSSIDKRIGDLVFDYRDPVQVFLKGRFSSYWYFAFSGLVTGYDTNDTFGSSQEFNLKCSDILWLLSKKKFSKRASIVMAGNMETSILNQDGGDRQFDILSKYSGSGPADKLIKKVIFGARDHSAVKNMFPLQFLAKDGIAFNQKDFELAYSNFIKKENRTELGLYSKYGYMFTYKDKIEKKDTSLLKEFKKQLQADEDKQKELLEKQRSEKYTIKTSDLKLGSNSLGFSPNEGQFSPWLPVYFQYNEIKPDKFSGYAMRHAYNGTLRYWEQDHTIDTENKGKKTGSEFFPWKDKNAFGVAGIHPAMTYDFVSNFNILEKVWRETMTKSKEVSKLEITPNDKIRETVVGAAKEYKSSSQGTHNSYFRPRFFLVLPKKWQNQSVSASGFAEFQLFNQDVTTALNMLSTIATKMEYYIFTSPMGDVFMEPSMHDMHPLEFWENIESRSILKKDNDKWPDQGINIKFRNMLHDNNKGTVCLRNDKAYFFDSDANHPFFIMEKDRIRVTHTLKPEFIKTSTTVIGNVTGKNINPVAESVFQRDPSFLINQTILSMGQGVNQKSVNKSPFHIGLYVADGFPNSVRSNNKFLQINKFKYVENLNKFNKTIVRKLINSNKDLTIASLIEKSINEIETKLKSTTTEKDKKELKELWPEGEALLSDLRAVISSGKKLNDISIASTGLEIKHVKLLNSLGGKIGKEIIKYSINLAGKTDNKGFISSWKKSPIAQKKVKEFVKENTNRTLKDGDTNDSTLNEISKFFLDKSKNGYDVYAIYKPIPLFTDQTIQDAVKTLTTSRKNTQLQGIGNKSIDEPVTVADLTNWAAAGIYNPREDFVRRYGFNAADPLYNMYVHNGDDAVRYAKTYFYKLYGQSQNYNISMVYRPELMLNRPYYLENKDSIGLLTNYSMSFRIGSHFNANVNLSYIRKNALTFKYSLGDLDEVYAAYVDKEDDSKSKLKSSITGKSSDKSKSKTKEIKGGLAVNQYFGVKAEEYYKDLYGAGWGNVLDNTVGKAVSGVAGSNAYEKIKSLFGDPRPKGGLYTAHDWIGHLDYEDNVYGGCTIISQIKIGCTDFNAQEATKIITLFNQLKNALESLRVLEQKIDKAHSQIKAKKDVLDKKEKQLEKEKDIKNKAKLNREVSILKRDIASMNSQRTSFLKEHMTLAIFIYGKDVYSNLEYSYYPDVKDKKSKRIPTLSELGKSEDQNCLYFKIRELFKDNNTSKNTKDSNVKKKKGSTKKPAGKYEYLDDRSDKKKLKVINEFGVDTPVYVYNTKDCVPIKKKPFEIKVLFINFKHDSAVFIPTRGVKTKPVEKDGKIIKINTNNDKEIKKIIKVLKRSDCISVDVIGHCSVIGPKKYNQKLSERRARSIVNVIKKRLGDHKDSNGVTSVSKIRSVVGKGEDEGYIKNKRNGEPYETLDRRVVFNITYDKTKIRQ